MSPNRRNLIVGVTVVAALLALGWMILKFSATSASSLFAKGTTFRLKADRVDGVSEGSQITYLGVVVGRVTEVRRDASDPKVIVDALLDTPLPPPKNVQGFIRAQSALGPQAMIVLEVIGQPSAEPLKAGDVVEAHFAGGGVIPPEFAALAKDINERELIKNVNEMIRSIKATADNLTKLSGDRELQSDIKETVSNVRQASENLQKFSARMDEITGETKATLTQVRTTVNDTGTQLNEVTKQLGERLTQTGDVLARFQSVAAKVDKGDGTVGQLVNDPRLYESLVDASKELNETVKTLHRLSEQWEQEGPTIRFKLK